VVKNENVKIVVNLQTGKINYHFNNGTQFNNTVAYVDEKKYGYQSTGNFKNHTYTIDDIKDPIGKGSCINVEHDDEAHLFKLVQHITLYDGKPFLLISAEAEAKNENTTTLETNNISPLCILPQTNGNCLNTGSDLRLVDFPFDNDSWVDVMSQKWKDEKGKNLSGQSCEYISVHDENTKAGFVLGSITHDFWKTGIKYVTGYANGMIDSLIVYGGAATKDDRTLPASQGGLDGTHDVIPHGTMTGATVQSPLIFLSASADVRKEFVRYGELNTTIAGKLTWKGFAPFYWNSFGVEGVLGYEKVMMPLGVGKISDSIFTLKEFNKYASPVLSVDSYDGGIYTTNVLSSISKYGKKKNQQMGFYFGPFSFWGWSNSLNQTKLQGTDYLLADVVLKDNDGKPVPYKNGDWAAFPIDPTHPATRAYIIANLQKAKEIKAKFIKIDFLTAGALEASNHYDPSIRTGMQAYNYGMKMFKHLVDSIMGPDIFITMAISPMFPHQYAHTRFVSTDVYSHLRGDQKGFPSWGSTVASMISASHQWWVQGTLWPYTNMDVSIMKNFQKNPDLNEQEIKVRIFSMMALGSILGDGSDLRNNIAMNRARIFLNNAAVCKFFSNPKAFTPLKFSDGNGQDQQLAMYLPADTILLATFNFDLVKPYIQKISRQEISLPGGSFEMRDFLTDKIIGRIDKTQNVFEITTLAKDAQMIKLVSVK